jgi:hypothetical protein
VPAPFRLVLRVRIVLLAASELGTCEDTARKWGRRYCGPCSSPGVCYLRSASCLREQGPGTSRFPWTGCIIIRVLDIQNGG